MGATVTAAVDKGVRAITNKTAISLQNLKTVYDSCLTSGFGQKAFIAEINSWLTGLGGLPLLDPSWTPPSTGHVNQLYGQLGQKYYATPPDESIPPVLIGSMVDTNPRHVDINTLIIQQGSLLLGAPYKYFTTANEDSYVGFIQAMAKLLKSTVNTTAVEAAAKRIFTLEQQLADKAIIPDKDLRNYSAQYNPINYTDMNSKYPLAASINFTWTGYISSLLPADVSDLITTNKRVVVVSEPAYFQALTGILKDYTEADLVNYALISVLWSHARMGLFGNMTSSSEDFKQLLELSKSRSATHAAKRNSGYRKRRIPPFTVTEDNAKIESQCINTILIPLLGKSTGRIYIDQINFSDDSRNEISAMITNVISALNGTIAGLDWFDEASKKNAEAKAAQIVKNPGYPDWIKNDSALNSFYADFKPTDQMDWFTLYNTLLNWYSEKQFEALKSKPDRRFFDMSPALVNAEYIAEKNSISFPAAILQAPLFRTNGPKVCNYGSIGMVLGHELTHGFDDEGVQYDGTGALKNWIDETSKVGFNKRAKCIIDEYSNFTFQYKGSTVHLNGPTNQGENIADNGGLRQALKAYKAHIQESGAEGSLPGLEQFSWEQIFFLSAASFWCGEQSASYMNMLVETNPHSPNKFRVLGTLRNMDEFAEAFGCKGTTMGMNGMNPPCQEKCYVWANEPKGC
jgi:predicted metalloendopeptidase